VPKHRRGALSIFVRVSGTHLWEIGLGQKFESSTSDLGKEEWQEERSEVELWGSQAYVDAS